MAPWYFGFASETFAAWNAWVFGATAVILAVLALMQTYDWEVYAIAAAGIWTCLAPCGARLPGDHRGDLGACELRYRPDRLGEFRTPGGCARSSSAYEV
ncbi:SPW repeat protein [Methylobacterium oryzae CBMB20]